MGQYLLSTLRWRMRSPSAEGAGGDAGVYAAGCCRRGGDGGERRGAARRALHEQVSAVVPTSRGADMVEWGKADR